MAMKQYCVELFAQDRTALLGDMTEALADGVYTESDVTLDGEPVGPPCNRLCIATLEEDEVNELENDTDKWAFIMEAAGL